MGGTKRMARRGLGRGLGALIPGADVEHLSGLVQDLDIASLSPNPFQPRQGRPGPEFDELVASIRRHGILQPVVARPANGAYQIVAGERRFRAAQAAGLTTVPAVVRDISDREALEVALIENIRREDLNPMERARAYRRLGAEFGLTQEEIGEAVGGSRASISNTMRLLDLPEEVQLAIDQGRLTEGHGRALLAVPDRRRLLQIWKHVEKRELSVRETEVMVKAATKNVSRETITRRGPKDPLFTDLGARLQDRYATSVTITTKGKKGTIQINYYSADDLERLIDLLLR
ncbi:MAG: ParB/RepB/Spo0J family partition protein [Bacillati bacterium ANGP1]|uniref:ParB/RepB/Spo0J family partition protein n=1 Tax=Candidatus Segetimicrobium genomatis TaxID=2569760 RepID=A0A537JAQ8_9BACT|nr:MAG: ParB/RepB/Spo0J family partition protein [Terrabacteria group bacterium ANGP1]